MSVFMRTGRDTAVSFPWWFYLLVVLPLQLLVAFGKAMLWLLILLGAGVLWVGRQVRDRVHNENRPPTP